MQFFFARALLFSSVSSKLIFPFVVEIMSNVFLSEGSISVWLNASLMDAMNNCSNFVYLFLSAPSIKFVSPSNNEA